jgi:hypothetical protein
MIQDFARISGPRLSSRDNFEELICQLLALEMGAQALDGSGGDGGIDCFRDTGSGIEVFQAKYFLSRLTPGQRAQVKHSLSSALERPRLRRWVLCIPLDPTPGELAWFEKLTPPEVTIEWWGASKLRSLLSKHPSLAGQFFAADQLEHRFAEFQEEIRRCLLASSHLPFTTPPAGDPSRPIVYLRRARHLGDLLLADVALLDESSPPTIAIDAHEIVAYLSIDSSLAWAPPVFDFCMEQSPFKLALLKPSAFELYSHLDAVGQRGMASFASLRQERHLHDPMRLFVEDFERDPDSAETSRAFHRLNRLLGSDILASGTTALPRLLGILRSGRLKLLSEPSWREAGGLEEIHDMFRRVRPRGRGNLVDAATLALVRDAWSAAPDSIRMLSSVPSFLRVAREIFDQRSPVRTSPEYAYFAHSARRAGLNGEKMNEQASSLRQAASRLASFAESGFSQLSGTRREDALAAFAAFAPSYRDLLKPVDDMISSAASVTPQMRHLGMQELYRYLVGEARLVDGFRRWWEQVCETITAIRQSMQLGESETDLRALYGRLDRTSLQ